MTIDSIHATGHHEEFDGEHGPALLAAHLRGAAIELLHRRETDREWLVTLLEAAATVILDQREKLREVPSSPGARRLAEIKEQHRRAYERWTTEDDASLRQQYAEGHSVTELAKTFQRQPSAIRSRLRKLGVEVPDDATEQLPAPETEGD